MKPKPRTYVHDTARVLPLIFDAVVARVVLFTHYGLKAYELRLPFTDTVV